MNKSFLAVSALSASVGVAGFFWVNHDAIDRFSHDSRTVDFKYAWSFFLDRDQDPYTPDEVIWSPPRRISGPDLVQRHPETCDVYGRWTVCALLYKTRIGNDVIGWDWGEAYTAVAWTASGARCKASALRYRDARKPIIPANVNAASGPSDHWRGGQQFAHAEDWDAQMIDLTRLNLSAFCERLVTAPGNP